MLLKNGKQSKRFFVNSYLKSPHCDIWRQPVVDIHIPPGIGAKHEYLSFIRHVPLKHGLIEPELDTTSRTKNNQLSAGDAVKEEVNVLPTGSP